MNVSFWNLSHDKLYELEESGKLDNGTIIVCPDVERMYVKLGDKLMPMTPSKKARHIESQIWNKIYEKAKEGKLDLYTKEENIIRQEKISKKK